MEPAETELEPTAAATDPASQMTAARSRGAALRNLLIAGTAVLLVVLYLAASHYQPLSIRPSWADSGPLSSSREMKMSLETSLSNTGPFGVSVLALHPRVYADPPVVVHPLMPCVHIRGTPESALRIPKDS